jgi:hypothetical protein
MGKVQACYTAGFKLEVVRYVQELGNRVVETKFDVGETNVRWSQVRKKNQQEYLKRNGHLWYKSERNRTWRLNYISILCI